MRRNTRTDARCDADEIENDGDFERGERLPAGVLLQTGIWVKTGRKADRRKGARRTLRASQVYGRTPKGNSATESP